MDTGDSHRNSWIACPHCGHKVARIRTCDAEFKCKHCGHQFEVIIRSILPANSSHSQALTDAGEPR